MSNKNEEFKSASLCVAALLFGFTIAMVLKNREGTAQKNEPAVQEYKMHDLIYPVTDYDIERIV